MDWQGEDSGRAAQGFGCLYKKVFSFQWFSFARRETHQRETTSTASRLCKTQTDNTKKTDKKLSLKNNVLVFCVVHALCKHNLVHLHRHLGNR